MDDIVRTKDGVAKALGLFSLGLGAAQVAMPSRVNRLVGIQDTDDNRKIMMGVGMRELVAAAGILRTKRPAGWTGARVAGDAMDLALLGAALNDDRNDQRRVTMATLAVAGITLVDMAEAGRLATTAKGNGAGRKGETVSKHSMTVNRPVAEVYEFWHDFEKLPTFMYHLQSVTVTGPGQTHWVANAPMGSSIEWDAQLTDDRQNEVIAWRSTEGASVPNWGSVNFRPAPGNRGTELTVVMGYRPPGGALGAAFAKLFGESPEQQIQDDLRRFKQVIETGEVLRSDGAPDGTSAKRQLHQRPAEPLESDRTLSSVGGANR